MLIQTTGNTLNVTSPPISQAQRAQTSQNDNAQKKDVSDKLDTPSIQSTDKNAVQEATKRLQEFVSEVRGGDIQFSMDNDSGKTVVKVIDRGTKEVIRQFPSEDAIELAKALDRFQGLLVKQQA